MNKKEAHTVQELLEKLAVMQIDLNLSRTKNTALFQEINQKLLMQEENFERLLSVLEAPHIKIDSGKAQEAAQSMIAEKNILWLDGLSAKCRRFLSRNGFAHVSIAEFLDADKSGIKEWYNVKDEYITEIDNALNRHGLAIGMDLGH